MVSSSLFLLAFSGAASAIQFGDWSQHNGLIRTYNSLIKQQGDFISMVENLKDVTVFVPTDDAFDRWNVSLTYAAQKDLLNYMVVPGQRYTVKDLWNVNSVKTNLEDESVKISTTGLGTDVDVIAHSGSNYTTNSTVGVVNPDFPIENGYVQLVSTVFQLPTDIQDKANQDTTIPSSASKNTIGAISALSLVGLGLMAVL